MRHCISHKPPGDQTLRNKDLDALDNSGEENKMKIATNFDISVHMIHVDQETLPFKTNSFIVSSPLFPYLCT